MTCPDQNTHCSKGDTCCNTSAETFGCCPKGNAVCCDDMKHCCPEGHICNVEKGKCVEKYTNLLFIQKPQNDLVSSLLDNEPNLQDIKCGDNVSTCPDGTTCCKKLGQPGLGCCKGIRAVCCSDELHCCPENTKCDLTRQACIKSSSVSLLKTYIMDTDTHFPNLKTVVCPDGKTQCPDGSTCCTLVTGSYGCCPRPEAICCDDKIHCCPHGYTCNPNIDTCSHGDVNIPMLKKVPALPFSFPLKQLVCPGESTVCGMNDTCCQHPDGSWACCPIPKAVCCNDGYHCCPENHTCDIKDFVCKKNLKVPDISYIELKNEHLLWTNALSAYVFLNSLTNICPGEKYECKDDQACCLLLSGAWGCCPGKQGVCCPDKQHCCPEGFQCESNGTCIQVNSSKDDQDLL